MQPTIALMFIMRSKWTEYYTPELVLVVGVKRELKSLLDL